MSGAGSPRAAAQSAWEVSAAENRLQPTRSTWCWRRRSCGSQRRAVAPSPEETSQDLRLLRMPSAQWLLHNRASPCNGLKCFPNASSILTMPLLSAPLEASPRMSFAQIHTHHGPSAPTWGRRRRATATGIEKTPRSPRESRILFTFRSSRKKQVIHTSIPTPPPLPPTPRLPKPHGKHLAWLTDSAEQVCGHHHLLPRVAPNLSTISGTEFFLCLCQPG